MSNRNNEEFDFDDGLEEATALTHLESDPHPDIPTQLPGVEIERKQVTDDLDTIDRDINPMTTARAI